EICEAYAVANQLLGDIVKVTPSSKVVGDLALFMVTNGLTADDLEKPSKPLSFPQSVVEMMQGMLGVPEGGWPPGFQAVVLGSAHVKPIEGRPGVSLPAADFSAVARKLRDKLGREPREGEVLTSVLYPEVHREYLDHVTKYGDTSSMPTVNFFYGLQTGDEMAAEIEPGKTLIVRYLTTGDVHEDGTRTVFFELNGQPRDARVLDRSVEAVLKRHPKAEPGNPNHVAAPMPGKISLVAARPGEVIHVGDRLVSIEAMKMETAVNSVRDAKVAEVLVGQGAVVDAGDLLIVLED